MENIIIIFLLVIFIHCTDGFGNVLVRLCQLEPLYFNNRLFTITLGTGLCSIIIFFLGILGLLYSSIIWLILVAFAIIDFLILKETLINVFIKEISTQHL